MKILVIGDPHFKVNNVRDTDLMVEKILEISKNYKPDLIVNLGDTLDRHDLVNLSPLKRSIDFMLKLKEIAFTILIIGNHDRPNNSTFLTDDHAFTGLKEVNNLIVVDKPILLQFSRKILFVPYVPAGRFMEAIQGCDINNIDLIFSHQEYKGAKMGAIVSETEEWPIHYPYVISGHVHDYDQLQENLLYTGTPIQHSFGDKKNKGITLIDFPDNCNCTGFHKCMIFERVNLNVCNKITLKVEANELSDIKDKIDQLKSEGNDIRLVITGTESEIASISKRNDISELSLLTKVTYDCKEDTVKDEIPKPDIKTNFLTQLYEKISNDPNISKIYTEIFN